MFLLKILQNINYFFIYHFYFKKNSIFASSKMVVVAQLVRVLDCGSRCRRFDSGHPPKKGSCFSFPFFYFPQWFEYSAFGILKRFIFKLQLILFIATILIFSTIYQMHYIFVVLLLI